MIILGRQLLKEDNGWGCCVLLQSSMNQQSTTFCSNPPHWSRNWRCHGKLMQGGRATSALHRERVSREGCDVLPGFRSHISIFHLCCRSRTMLSPAEMVALSSLCSAWGMRAQAPGWQPRKSLGLRGGKSSQQTISRGDMLAGEQKW